MRNWTDLTARAGALVLAVTVLGPAAARADVFAWRTEDGVFAYTDDAKRIPKRYADEAVRVRDTQLREYPRLTREDTATTQALAERLQKRLDHLRRLNAPTPAPAEAVTPGPTRISVATGNGSAIDLVADDASAEPIVVEPILSHSSNESRTRRATLVTQGDRTLAVVKSRSHHYNVNEDIYDEDALDARR